MCGITGFYSFKEGSTIVAPVLKEMMDIISHRGPDDSGSWFGFPFQDRPRVGLGHRRLSIIDLAKGQQPMTNEDGSCRVIYNGEIYNYKKLRGELEAKGHKFSTASDTEVILHLYEEYGKMAPELLNGMFAFALWDERRKRMLLARDRTGTKSLYYWNDGNILLFGSEIKSLLKSGLFHTELDQEAMREYFTFQNIISDRTLFRNVRMLKPGWRMMIEDNKLTSEEYWDFRYTERPDRGEQYYVDRLRELLPEVVKNQLVSDVPLGSFLSGGIDSSTLVVLANRFLSPLNTFTVGFNMDSVSGLETSFDERKEVEELINTLHVRHHDVVLHSGDMQSIFPKLVWHLEDLKLGISHPNYYACNLASKFVKVVLSGAGGDEIFAGYPWRYQLGLEASEKDFSDIYFNYWQRLVKINEQKDFFSAQTFTRVRDYDLKGMFTGVLGACSSPDRLDKILYFESKTFLAGLLTVDDKLGMANSVEVRVPFLDNDLIDFMETVPAIYKYRQGSSKYLLKKALAGILPEFVLKRKKQGFASPEQSWYKGPSMGYVREILLNDRTLGRGYFNADYIKKSIDEHISGQVNQRLLIWSLLSFEWWCRIFLDGMSLDEIRKD